MARLTTMTGAGVVFTTKGSPLGPVSYRLSVERVRNEFRATGYIHGEPDVLRKIAFEDRAVLMTNTHESFEFFRASGTELGSERMGIIIAGGPMSDKN